jgi:hypothetical protein
VREGRGRKAARGFINAPIGELRITGAVLI